MANRDDKIIEEIMGTPTGERIFSVATFLDLLNEGLTQFRAKIKGEVSSVDERNGHFYFSLKDRDGDSVINCILWKNSYLACGVRLKIGLEVILYGRPNVYKPTGRLSFVAETVELVGEGELKKAYDQLRLKLEKEGLFSPRRKKELPIFPERIGLITSRDGAVINDFLNNIGQFGYKIQFRDSRVEGQLAVNDLLRAVKYFEHKNIEILVIIRGGGSLESLLAFNNEALVRALADYPVPVIVGLGHDKDVPLLAEVADLACSTPTAVAHTLNSSWSQARAELQLLEKNIVGHYDRQLADLLGQPGYYASVLKNEFTKIINLFHDHHFKIKSAVQNLNYLVTNFRTNLNLAQTRLVNFFQRSLHDKLEFINQLGKIISFHDPHHQLRLGYSLVRSKERILKSVMGVKKGETIEIILADGSLGAEIKSIKTN